MRFTEEEKLELMSILDQITPVSQVDWEAAKPQLLFVVSSTPALREKVRPAILTFPIGSEKPRTSKIKSFRSLMPLLLTWMMTMTTRRD